MKLNKINNNKSIKEQRENLLEQNNDLVYGIYEIIKNEKNKITLRNIENILVCFPEKFETLNGLKENEDISIIDIKAFRAGEIKFLNGDNSKDILENKNLTLLSSGVIEILKSYYKNENGEIKQRNHFPTTLRDNGTIGGNLRNPVAGRNSTSDLIGDIEREYSEESPYLGKNKNGEYCLFTPERADKEKAFSDLKGSIEFFLESKYLKNIKEDDKIKKLFEQNFRYKIKYEELGDILKDIEKNNRFEFYESKVLENFNDFEGIKNDLKEIEMVDKEGKIISNGIFFVNDNKKVKTIEYMQLREIKLPKGVLSPTAKLYLESQNQGSKNERIETLGLNTLPIIKSFSEKVLSKLKN